MKVPPHQRAAWRIASDWVPRASGSVSWSAGSADIAPAAEYMQMPAIRPEENILQDKDMEASAKEIIIRVQQGELEAYAELVGLYKRQIRGIISFALRNEAETEDMVQQTFVKAYQHLDKYDPRHDFGTWLRTIARNLVRNELRRLSREDRRMRLYHQHLLVRNDSVDKAEEYEQTLKRALNDCRAQLSPVARQALALRYEQGHNFGEVATMLGRTVAAARQMLTRVRSELRRCIEKRMAANEQT